MSYALDIAIENGHDDIIILLKRLYVLPITKKTNHFITSCEYAIRYGHSHSIMCIFNEFPILKQNIVLCRRILNIAAEYGANNIINFIHDEIPSIKCAQDIYACAAYHNNFDTVILLHKLYPSVKPKSRIYNELIRRDKAEMFSLLCNLFPPKCSYSVGNIKYDNVMTYYKYIRPSKGGGLPRGPICKYEIDDDFCAHIQHMKQLFVDHRVSLDTITKIIKNKRYDLLKIVITETKCDIDEIIRNLYGIDDIIECVKIWSHK